MVKEIARPVVLILCILSLYAVFEVAFFDPGTDVQRRILDVLAMLGLAGVVSLLSGCVFADSAGQLRHVLVTLPVRLFCWVSGAMVVLFAVAWYLETYSVFEGHVRY